MKVHLTATGCHLSYEITVLPVNQHKWTHPAWTPTRQAVSRFTYPGGIEGWVALSVILQGADEFAACINIEVQYALIYLPGRDRRLSCTVCYFAGCWWVCGMYKHRGTVRQWAHHRCRRESWRHPHHAILWPCLGLGDGGPWTTLPQGSGDSAL